MPSSLKPWHAVAIPHDDIQKGRLSEAVFAAETISPSWRFSVPRYAMTFGQTAI